MANMYISIAGFPKSNGVPVNGLGDEGSWFAINSFSWGGMRNVNMSVGNGHNRDGGVTNVSEVSITKEADAALPWLLSFLYSPGAEGKDVRIAITKPDVTGDGVGVFLQMTLKNARMVSYHIGGGEGQIPSESFSLAFVEIGVKYNPEDETGKLTQGSPVIFNVPLGSMLSGATLVTEL